MAENDEFFLPAEVDRQIEQVRQLQAGNRKDAEALAYLRSYYQVDAEREQEALDRIWKRIATDTPLFREKTSQKREKGRSMDQQNMHPNAGVMGGAPQARSRRSPLMRRLSMLAAIVVLIALVGSMAGVLYAVRQNGGGPASPHIPASGPLQVTSVDMSVTPQALTGLACGMNVTVTYTARFHVNSNNTGGKVQFNYTLNNGRSQAPASLTFNPGETSKAYSFTWSGALPADHTYPGEGGVQVTSPNQLTSALVKPSGQCGSSALQVTKIDMAVSPASIQGLACGTNLTVTYTATIYVASGSSGGTVQFTYTVNNGRGDTPVSVTFNPGETSKAYSFSWSGALPADHTYPGQGGIQVTSPNQLTSALVAPTGQCGSSSAAFQVTSVAMAVSPASIQGTSCGTSTVVTYTATIRVAPNGPGGTVHFTYTVNNGRGQTPASITFSPGQTVGTYNFSWSGALPADHTYPGQGGIQVTSPNQLTSPSVAPTGTCH